MLIAAAMSAPLIFAVALDDPAAGAFLFSAVVTGVTGAGAMMLTAGRRAKTDLRSAILVVLLWWTIAPAFAALPMVLRGLAPLDAYFEAVSALTTTGAWLSNEEVFADRIGLLWRAVLQWIGGLASISIAAAVFIRPAFIPIDTLLPPFSRGEHDSHLRPIANAVGAFAIPYAVLTGFAFAILLSERVPVLEAIVLAASSVASGGIAPNVDGLGAYPSFVAVGLYPVILISGANFVLFSRLLRGDARGVKDLETRSYLIITAAVAAGYFALSGEFDPARIPAQMFNAASLLSTNGVLIGAPPPLIAALVTAIIGGAAISTAGGFKILRWLVIMRRGREEIRRLVTPNGVFGSSRVVNELGVWMHFLVFTLTLAALVLLIAVSGHSFELAVTAATAILSNCGPLLELAANGDAGYGVFEGPLRLVLIIGMILGRLEAVAALALFNQAFWRS